MSRPRFAGYPVGMSEPDETAERYAERRADPATPVTTLSVPVPRPSREIVRQTEQSPPAASGWKSAALLLGGGFAGFTCASVLWAAAAVGIAAAGGFGLFEPTWSPDRIADYGADADGEWDDGEMAAAWIVDALADTPAVRDTLGGLDEVRFDEDRSYDSEVWNEWYYDVTGPRGDGVLRVLLDDDALLPRDYVLDGDLTLPDGTVVNLFGAAGSDA